ncbi:MAG: FG-GAP-like repeat-containing protein, partial [bacterium]|nr:FG-GAP-like repeat-containing protein [bacterium]
MKQMKKYVWLALSMLIVLLMVVEAMATVPASPSVVTMNGKQMRVQHRREDNTLKAAVNYVIKGVCYSVATVWPVETYPPGGPFENDDRRRSWEMAQYDFPRIKEAGFNTIRLYSDLGLDTDSSLYFDEDTNGVIWNADGTAQDDDNDNQEDWLEGMATVGDLNSQSVTHGLAVLDEAYKNGLKVIMIVDGFNANSALAQKIVATYKNHPAILMWMLGNEFNYNFNDQELYMWRYDTFQEACTAVNDIAYWIKNNDSNHPVVACLGEPHYPSYEVYKAGVANLTDIDIIGENSYRGRSFGNVYEMYADTVTWTKPIFFSEYGVDAWRYNTDSTKEFEDIASQKEGEAWQWDEIHSRLSANNSNDMLLGSCLFEWVDEWWKLKGGTPLLHENTPGYPVNTEGQANSYLWPDGCMQEEWWGINQQDTRNINQVFFADCGLIGETRYGSQSWDIYTWGLPIGGDGYGKINAQSDYVASGSPDYGVRKTYSPYPEYSYTGGTGTGNTIPEGHRCMYTELWSTSWGGGWGLFRTNDTINLSQFASGNLKFWLKLQKAGTPPTAIGDTAKANYSIKFEDENGPEKAVLIFLDESYCSEFDATSTAWQEITIPISALSDGHSFSWLDANNTKVAADGSHIASLNLARMKMVFSFTGPKLGTGETNTQFWVDNVRWDNATTVYNRTARPALIDYRNKFNNFSYLKTVFESGAVSYMGTPKYARLTKNYSILTSTDTVSNPCILSVALNPKTGRTISTGTFTDYTSLNNWVDQYDNNDDDYVLSFTKFNNVGFLSSCTKLGTIGSTMYTTAGSGDPWVFVTHVVNGSSTAKKESIGANSLAEVSLAIDLDTDNDGVTNVNDTDSDGDGLTNAQELRYGTDPLNADTDADTYSDSTEVTNNTNARNPDSKVLSTDTQAKLIVKPQVLAYSNSEIQSGKDRYLYIENDGGEYLSYKVDINYTNGSGWLTIKYRNHASNEAWTAVTTGSYLYKDLDDYVLQVLVDTSTMTTAQTYSGTVTITANDDDGSASGSQVINVSVPIAPELKAYPENIDIKTPDTDSKIYVENSGTATLSYSLSQTMPVSWLTIDPTNGSATTETDLIDLTVNWTGLTADTSTIVKVDGGTAGVKYIKVNAYQHNRYCLDATISDVDASYIGLEKYDYEQCEAIDTGDLNGDGYDDILIGALSWDQNTKGKAYIIWGKKDGWHMDDTVASATRFFGVGRPEDNTGFLGTGVAMADVNGDGRQDVVIGDKCAYITGDFPGYEQSDSPAGAVFIFLGKEEGWKQQYTIMDADIVILAPEISWADFGDVVAAGDFNNDGYDDLVVGSDNQIRAAYVIFGRSDTDWHDYLQENCTLTSTTPHVDSPGDIILPDVTKFYNSGQLNPSNTWVDKVKVGDFDNDGYDDIWMGYNQDTGDWNGKVYSYVIYGKAGKESTWGSDLDVYNNLNVAIPIICNGVETNPSWPGTEGDINGDGCYDILISSGGGTSFALFGSTTKWTAAKNL